jgi:hypothetical protein
MRKKSLALLVSLLFTCLSTQAEPAPHLDHDNFAQWRDFILPNPGESKWQEIPWHESFWKGLLQAQEQNKPLLLWAMNGHPLGCT